MQAADYRDMLYEHYQNTRAAEQPVARGPSLEQVTQLLFEHYDCNKSGTITVDEFEHFYRRLSSLGDMSVDEGDLYKQFDVADEDRNSCISRQEWVAFCKAFIEVSGPHNFYQLAKQVLTTPLDSTPGAPKGEESASLGRSNTSAPKSAVEVISTAAARRFILRNFETVSQNQDQEICRHRVEERKFDEFDKNNDQVLDKDEFVAYAGAKLAQYGLGSEGLSEIFQRIDIDKSGGLSFQEVWESNLWTLLGHQGNDDE